MSSNSNFNLDTGLPPACICIRRGVENDKQKYISSVTMLMPDLEGEFVISDYELVREADCGDVADINKGGKGLCMYIGIKRECCESKRKAQKFCTICVYNGGIKATKFQIERSRL